MDLKKMYYQSLENAFELVKVAKSKDDIALDKANIYSHIALAIATAAVDIDEAPEPTPAPVPVPKEEPVPVKEEKSKTEEAPKRVINPAVAKLAQDVAIPLPPDRMEDEDETARQARYAYLLEQYKDTAMKDLPEEVYPYLMPEANVNTLYEWLWNDALHDDADKRKASIVKDFTEGKATTVADVPLSLYLEKIIPCEQDWIYFMMFENAEEINTVLAKCTNNRYKDFRTLNNFSVGVWRTATKKYMENNFSEIEKVS